MRRLLYSDFSQAAFKMSTFNMVTTDATTGESLIFPNLWWP